MSDENKMEFDVVIVGGGPAGLSAAIRLRQLAYSKGTDISVCVLEKAAEIGGHILSGAVIETKALDELIPDWREKNAPLQTPAGKDEFLFLTEEKAYKLPTPRYMKNHGNYIVSLANVTRWLGEQAESLEVQIFPGFPAADYLVENGKIVGVKTGEFGIDKDGAKKDSYQEGIEIRAKHTIFAEGCRGSLTERVIRDFKLRPDNKHQTYALGVKEVWQIDAKNHEEGKIVHSIGWPLDDETYGGSFMYHMEDNQISVGYVVGLDYKNPHLDIFEELQRFKTHPEIKPIFEGAKRIAYGARALNEGGLQSLPKLSMPGAAIVGCAAGFLNVPKIKGTHNAMKSGMLAAEAVYDAFVAGEAEATTYEKKFKKSYIYKELRQARNIRPSFKWGLIPGLIYSAIDTYLLFGMAPWTFAHGRSDRLSLKRKEERERIKYPKPDGVLTFDKLSSVYLSNTNHEEDQPSHLALKDKATPIDHNNLLYDSPETRYCPASVYEIVQDDDGEKHLQINAQNCVHCKTCDIKDPTGNIVWVTPEGGGGPNYGGM